MTDLPSGTVTFLFTDVEGSTRMVQTLGERWPPILETHNRLLRDAIRAADGIDIRTEGDSFFAVFRSAASAVTAAAGAQRALAGNDWPTDAPVRVRMGIHTGDGAIGGDDYVGLDVHRAARIAAAGHGGQVLLSSATIELVRGELPRGVELHDLGAHRLKDLARPERIYQLAIDGLEAEFPPIRSLETPTNVPLPRTSFVGRQGEVARVKELLRGPGLLTLTGPGGSGKTRLALQAARELLGEYPDGVFFVEMAPITDAPAVPSRIAASIGVRSEGARPELDTLMDHLRDRQLLLVLDNFEQLMEAAPFVADMLDASPRTRILVTSREALHLAGEQELEVPPLAVPDAGQAASPQDAARFAAVTLFVQRATAMDPAFRLTDRNAPAVAELCARLDGLPLAIELAASRVKLLSPESMLERMERRFELLGEGPVDVPDRQRSLRKAIAWSYDLLDEPERTLLRHLSVFAGGWSLDAAEAVAMPSGEIGPDVLSLLGSLVDKSLVVRVSSDAGAVRFRMLETIREFAAEQLEKGGEAGAVRQRHAAFFLAMAEAAEPHLRSMDQKRWLDDLDLEHDNIRAALRFAIDAGRADVGMRMVGALWRFWHLRSHLNQGRLWAEEVLALPGASERTTLRVRALNALGGVTYWQEDVPVFRAAYEEALVIARELGDREAEAEGIYNLSFVRPYEGDFEGAAGMVEESRLAFERVGNRRGVADTLWLLGIGARLGGDLVKARELAEESLRLHRKIGDRFGAAVALYALGRVAFQQGDIEVAEASLLEALDNDEDVGSRTGMALVLDNLAAMASADGDHVRAVRLAGASEAMKHTAGGHAPSPLIALPDPREAARAALGDEAVRAAWEEGRAMPLEQALALARQKVSRSV